MPKNASLLHFPWPKKTHPTTGPKAKGLIVMFPHDLFYFHTLLRCTMIPKANRLVAKWRNGSPKVKAGDTQETTKKRHPFFGGSRPCIFRSGFQY